MAETTLDLCKRALLRVKANACGDGRFASCDECKRVHEELFPDEDDPCLIPDALEAIARDQRPEP